jgi:hypothetical protein
MPRLTARHSAARDPHQRSVAMQAGPSDRVVQRAMAEKVSIEHLLERDLIQQVP